MRILSKGFPKLEYFHLLTHALFKALLFIYDGVNHSIKDSQDIRFIGNIYFQIHLTSTCLLISNLVLRGVHFLAEFFSKDLILEIVSLDYVNLIGYYFFFTARLKKFRFKN